MHILICYYSTYGHVFQLARAVAAGAAEVDGAEVRVRRVPELMPDEVIQANPGMRAGVEMQRDVPIAAVEDMAWADGVAFGTPTRFGNMSAQLKEYIDRLGKLWLRGALEGKPATCFTSTASLHGGQETTLLTMWVPLIHLGMLVFGVPYSVSELISTDRGGTPYGATTVAGPDNALQPNEMELHIARMQGRRLAEVTTKVRG